MLGIHLPLGEALREGLITTGITPQSISQCLPIGVLPLPGEYPLLFCGEVDRQQTRSSGRGFLPALMTTGDSGIGLAAYPPRGLAAGRASRLSRPTYRCIFLQVLLSNT